MKCSAWVAGLACALLTGCQKEEITVYRVPKVAPGTGGAETSMSSAGTPAASPGAAVPHAHWEKVPAGWQEQPITNSRLATFSIAGAAGAHAEAAIMAFPGSRAPDLDYVNIGRMGLKLPALTEADLVKIAQPATIAGAAGQIYDLTAAGGAEGASGRILVALHRQADTAWFIKLAGDTALVEAQKPAFLDFLKGLSLHATAHEGAGQPAPVAAAPPVASSTGLSKWTAPAHWKEAAPGAMQAAKYRVGEGKAGADVTVVFLGGMGGGLKPNLDRWRNQLSLPASAEGEIDQQAPLFPELGPGARRVQLSGSTGEGDPADMVVLIVPSGNGTWFYKLMGDKSVVAKEKDALTAFVKSAKL
ncbi:MAG: hypothetical protein EBS05_10245 [Proteobacteria bacterium]|nr:hypothetical protein [Pseudomonadota bacterium]